jgi:hypothetical protein
LTEDGKEAEFDSKSIFYVLRKTRSEAIETATNSPIIQYQDVKEDHLNLVDSIENYYSNNVAGGKNDNELQGENSETSPGVSVSAFEPSEKLTETERVSISQISSNHLLRTKIFCTCIVGFVGIGVRAAL